MSPEEKQEIIEALKQRRKGKNLPYTTTDKIGQYLTLLNQGVTLGLWDEAEAGLKSLFTNKDYDTALKEARQQVDAARRDTGWKGVAAEMAGGMAIPAGPIGQAVRKGATSAGNVVRSLRDLPKNQLTPISPARLNRAHNPRSFLRRVADGAVEGAGYGAVYGFNTGEDNIAERAVNAVIPAIAGTAGGALIPAASTVGGKIGQMVANKRHMRNTSIDNQDIIEPLHRIVKEDTRKYTKELDEVMPKDDGMVADIGPAARATLNDILSKSEDNFLNTARDPDIRMSATHDTMKKPEVFQRIHNRRYAASDDLRKTFDQVFGTPIGMQVLKGRISGTSDPIYALKGETKKDLKKLYELVYPEFVEMSDDLVQTMKVVNPADISSTRKLMKMHGSDPRHVDRMITTLNHFIKPQLDDKGIPIELAGDSVIPNVEFMDTLAKVIQDKAKKERDPLGTGSKLNTSLGRGYEKLVKRIRNEIGKSSPEYNEILGMATKSMRAKQLLDLGYDAMNLGKKNMFGDFKSELENMKLEPEEWDFVRQGMAESLFERMGGIKDSFTPIPSQTGYVTRVAIGDNPGKEALKIFSADDALEKARLILDEGQMNLLENALKETAAAFELEATSGENINSLMKNIIPNERGYKEILEEGNPLRAAGQAVSDVLGFGNQQRRQEAMGSLADYLTSKPQRKDLEFFMANDPPSINQVKGRLKGEMKGRTATRGVVAGASNSEDRGRSKPASINGRQRRLLYEVIKQREGHLQ